MSGLLWLIADAYRIRSRAFGEPGPLRRLRAWLTSWRTPIPQPVALDLGTATGRSDAAGEITVLQGETEIERLSREVKELRQQFAKREAQVERRFSEVENRAQQETERLEERLRATRSA